MTVYSWKLGSGDWDDAVDWTPNGPPASTDDAIISATGPAYVVTIDSADVAAALTENSANATVDDSVSLTLGAGFDLKAGAFDLEAGATLGMGGTFAMSGGSFTLSGTLSATTIALSGGTIDWNRGVIAAGTLDVAALNLSATLATVQFDAGVQVDNAAGTGAGVIDDTGVDSYLYLYGTQTFDNATLDLGGAQYTSYFDVKDLAGSTTVLTLGASLTIDAAGHEAWISAGYDADDAIVSNATIDQTAGAVVIAGLTFTNNGSIVANAAGGTFLFGTTSFTNAGTVGVTGAGDVLSVIATNFANTGTITVSNGGVIAFDAATPYTLAEIGTVTNSGGAIELETTLNAAGGALTGSGALGQATLYGGTLVGGVATSAGLVFSSLGGTLDDVVYEGALSLSASYDKVDFVNGTSVVGAGGSGSGAIVVNGAGAALDFGGTQSFNNATVNLGAASVANTPSIDLVDPLETGATLTLGSGVVIDATDDAMISAGPATGDAIIDQGTVNLTSSALTIEGNAFTNAGAINLLGPDDYLQIDATTFTNSGVFTVANSDDTVALDPTTFVNSGTIAISGGVSFDIEPTNFANFTNGVLTGGTYQVGAKSILLLPTNAAVVTLDADVALSGAGSLVEDFNTTTSTFPSLDATLRTIGAAGQLDLLAGRNLSTAAAPIADNGLVQLGGGTLTVTGAGSSFTIGAGGKLAGFGAVDATTLVDSGLVEASGGALTLQTAATGTGGYQIDAGATLTLDGAAASGSTATFNGAAGATLTLEAPGSFAAAIAGLATGDIIHLVGITANGATVNGSGQLVATENGATVAALKLAASSPGVSFLTQTVTGGTDLLAFSNPASVAQYLGDVAQYDEIAGGFAISDAATTIAADIGELADSHINSITATGGVVAVTAATALAPPDPTTLDKIAGGFNVADTASDISGDLNALTDTHIGAITISNDDAIGVNVGQLTSDATTIAKLANANGAPYQLAIDDGAADIGGAALDLLQSDLAHIAAITISDNGAVAASVGQLTSDAGALGELANANGKAFKLAITDTFGDIESGLATLVGDAGHIASITATGGYVSVATAIFGQDQSTLDEIVGGFNVADSAPNILTALAALDGDAHVHAIGVTSGRATLVAGTSIATPGFSISGALTKLTLGGSVAYAGAFTLGAKATFATASGDAFTLSGISNITGVISGAGTLALAGGTTIFHAGATVSTADWTLATAGSTSIAGTLSYGGSFSLATTLGVDVGDMLTLTGTSTLRGSVTGGGTLALSGGAATISTGALLNVAKWSVAGTAVTIGKSLAYAGALTVDGGATLTLSGAGAALGVSGKSDFADATIDGAGALTTAGVAGVATIAGLTIGGTLAWTNTAAINENGGALTLGDSVGDVAKLTNAKAGVYDILDDSGVALGSSKSSSIDNIGLFEKTGGTGTSAIAPGMLNTGAISVTSGELDLQGALTGTGTLTVGDGATLQVDGSVAATQTLGFATTGGEISLNDLDLAGAQLFHGAISGWAAGDSLDVGAAFGAGTLFNFVENGAETGGVLHLADGGATAAIDFVGKTILSTANFTQSASNPSLYTFNG